MIRIITVVGARPQFIKASAISRAVRTHFTDHISEMIVHTGQHYDDAMSEVFFRDMEIPAPAYNLGVGSGMHGEQTAEMIRGLEEILQKELPDMVLVYGDTNSTLAAALAASKLQIPLAHVEAGLRSFNKNMPEEINRIVCDHCATFLYTPTRAGLNNLIREGLQPDATAPFNINNPKVELCGDVMYDNALYFASCTEEHQSVLQDLSVKAGAYFLATLHRDHNTDDARILGGILEALSEIAIGEGIPIVLPMHPRTRKEIQKIHTPKNELLIYTEPVSYFEMLMLEKHSRMILTDSGGIQKEACFFEKKCLVMRPETEWVELAQHGMLEVAGNTKESILKHFEMLNERKLSSFPHPYGDGHAAEQICASLMANL